MSISFIESKSSSDFVVVVVGFLEDLFGPGVDSPEELDLVNAGVLGVGESLLIVCGKGGGLGSVVGSAGFGVVAGIFSVVTEVIVVVAGGGGGGGGGGGDEVVIAGGEECTGLVVTAGIEEEEGEGGVVGGDEAEGKGESKEDFPLVPDILSIT